MYSLPNQSHSW